MRHDHIRCFSAAAVVMLSGCYEYAAAGPAALPSGADVRLVLTPSGATTLLPILGRGTTAVEGHVLSASDSGYRLAVTGTLKQSEDTGGTPTRTVWAREPVMIPRAAIGSVEQRSLNRRRTTFAIAVGTVAAALAVRLIVHALGSSGSEADGGTPVTPP